MTAQIAIPAAWMRGGTSKGLFFRGDVLPADDAARDRLLLRALGSPDPFGKQMDGVGGATSSTSKVVMVSPSARPDCDVDYLFGAVAIDAPLIDYSGSCGNLVAAVGPFAIEEGLIAPREGVTTVRIWQVNTGKRIDAHVPVIDGAPAIEGDCRIDGVPFAGAAIRIEFLDPGGGNGGALLPTGNMVDTLDVPGMGPIVATLLDAGNPTVFVRAADVGLTATELAPAIDGDAALLTRLEAIRAHGAVAMRLTPDAATASRERPATPKIAIVAPPADYVSSAGEAIEAATIDLCARILSMGRLHHAFTGTGSVALAAAAALPGTIPASVARPAPPGTPLRIGHTSGRLDVGAIVERAGGAWRVDRVVMRRTARRLMSGAVFVPPGIPAGGGIAGKLHR
jgi:probable AcnD-accessory protein PrpF